MPFTIDTFNCARGKFNCSAGLASAVIHTYTSNDTYQETAVPEYAPPYYGFSSENVRNGDFIMFHLSNLEGIVRIIDAKNNVAFPFILPPVDPPITQQFSAEATSFTGIWAADVGTTMLYGQTGKICQLTLPDVLDAATTSGVITLSGSLFVSPASDITIPMYVVDNGVQVMGKIKLTNSGLLIISPADTYNSGNFTGAGTSGFEGFTFSYNEFV